MNSTFRRVVAGFSLVAVVSVIAAAPSSAADTPTGVGGTSGAVNLIGAVLGDPANPASNPLNLIVVGENNATSIDPADGTPSAGESITALKAHSAIVPALDALSTTPVQTSTTGAQDQKTTQVVNLATLTQPALPGAISGSVEPATLTSIVDAAGARSSLNSTLANLSALLGTLSVDSSVLNVGGNASPTGSLAGRTAELDGIAALNLSDLTRLLGFSLDSLPIDTLAGLIDQLGLAPAVASATGLDLSNPGDLKTAFDDLQAAIIDDDTLLDALCSQGGLLVGVVQTCDLTTVQNELNSIVSQVLDTLAGTPLISIDQVKAAAGASAADTVANSAAAVTGSITGIKVGGLAPIGPIDAAATAAQIQALADQVNQALSDVLTQIDPSLANLLTVKLFDKNTNVFTEGDYVKSIASITALELTITPPDLCALFDDLGVNQFPDLEQDLSAGGVRGNVVDAPRIEDLLTQLGLSADCQVPIPQNVSGDSAVSGASVKPAVPTVPVSTTALTAPLTFRAASISSAANFKVVAAPVTPTTPATPELPRTGTNELLLLVVGGLLAAVALGVRRVTAVARATSRRR
jgi:LPXTG cell wall anchor motif